MYVVFVAVVTGEHPQRNNNNDNSLKYTKETKLRFTFDETAICVYTYNE